MRKEYLGLILLAAALAGCESLPDADPDDEVVTHRRDNRYRGYGKFFGEDTLLFGGDKAQKKPDVGIGVNSYLWKASLDTLSFMPLKSVDPFGGVILSEWYTSEDSSNERLKVDVRILDRVLRADGIRVSVFKQKFKGGRWVNMSVAKSTVTDLEDAILSRARQLRSNR